jgi:uncharacterized membrane protein YfcA
VDLHAVLVMAGLAIGLLYGMFGVGSAFATPVLALLGVPGLVAVAAPLPGILPGSVAGAWGHARDRRVDWSLARPTIAAALPATVIGALLSPAVGGPLLLVLSGVVLFAVGLRVLWPAGTDAAQAERTHRADARRARRGLVVAAAFGVGLAAGLLANGGGFLLVPLFLVGFGLDVRDAAGTSMACAAALSVPAVLAHAVVGDIDWVVSGLFALGMVPGAIAGSRVAGLVDGDRLRRLFGVLLVAFAVFFLARQFA